MIARGFLAALLCGWCGAQPGWAGEVLISAGAAGGVWREFGTQHGLPKARVQVLTLGQGGVLWAKYSGSGGVSAFDGYSVRNLPADPMVRSGVYESRTGQLWAMDEEGVREFRRDAWVRHEVEVVRAYLREGGERGVEPLRLVPAERNRFLLMLPGLLVKHDVLEGRSDLVTTVAELGFGEFVDLLEAQDGELWLVAKQGMARVGGPVRRVGPGAEWEVTRLPEDWRGQVGLVGAAYANPQGGVVVLAQRGAEGEFVGVTYDRVGWTGPIPLPTGVTRVWAGSGGELWAHGRETVYRRGSGDWVEVGTPRGEGTEILGLAVEPGGEFWLGTSEGLIRRAMALWQPPPEGPTWGEEVNSILEMPEGALWFAGDDRMWVRREAGWSEVVVASGGLDGIESRLYRLGSRVVFMDRAGKLGVVDESGTNWRVAAGEGDWRVERVLGLWRDGRLVVQRRGTGEGMDWRLDAFDGTGFETVWEPGGEWELGDRLHFVVVSRSGGLWLGSEGGLASWNERTGRFVRSENYGFGPARSLVELGDGRVWCTTGSAVFQGDGRSWVLVRPSSGTIERLVVARDGSLWGVGGANLVRWVDEAWVRHGEEEGLPASGTTDLCMDARGRLWAATPEGVWRHHPDADVDPPRTQVTAVGGRREFSTGEGVALVLRGEDRWAHAPVDHLLYSTRLNEGAWSPYRQGSVVVLTNLTAGQQRLEVRALDPALNEEPEAAVYEFTAYVPWYGEPRIVAVAMAGVTVAFLLAGLAINRHLRLLRSYAEVEGIVEQRTRELERANEELVHSQKMRALGTLAAGIAHDFNSILSIIKGSAQIIEGNVADAGKVRTRVDRIKMMVDQGAGLVKAMLGLSGASRQDWRALEMAGLLEETARMVGDQLPKDVSLHVEPPPALPPVRLAGDLFRQLLLNLILNAAEATSGQGRILVRAGLGTALGQAAVLPPAMRGPQIVVEVLDTGHGIAPEVLPRIFEPFFTTKSFSTRRGTGLGLTMVYEIARELGLGLGVESTPGQGSVFRIFVPIERGLQDARRPGAEEGQP